MGPVSEAEALRPVIAYHWGRHWHGTEIEDECPCPQEPCGLVNTTTQNAQCPQHGFLEARTGRQGHMAEDCPVQVVVLQESL